MAKYLISFPSAAMVVPDGEWEAARLYLPIFGVADTTGCVVVRLDDPQGPVGWYEDGAHDKNGGPYKDGVYALAPSLSAFLETLVDADEDEEDENEDEDEGDEDEGGDEEDEEEDQDELWEEAEEVLAEDDE